LKNLEKETLILKEKLKVKQSKKKSKRGNEKVLHIGCWRKSSPVVCLTKQTDNVTIAPHKDEVLDYRSGFCWIVLFGKFTGGELFFPELNIKTCFFSIV